jgi:homoserine dehydrogenase
MTAVDAPCPDVRLTRPVRTPSTPIRVGLLGLGHVGSAVARLARTRPPAARANIEIAAALVRDPLRIRAVQDVPLTTDPDAVFLARPAVVVEALGGLEPARTLVLEAIARGLPVVTANKSLLAHHGDEIAEAAALAGVAVRYEASVIAGVPFLGTFARRPYASAVSAITAIVNGTSNFVLSRMQDLAVEFGSALSDAQRRGFAEPDPFKDVEGVDAAEKLAILIRLFAGRRVAPSDIETTGIRPVTPVDLRLARELGGTLKPVVTAEGLTSTTGPIGAFAGSAFVPGTHSLARVHYVSNGICLRAAGGSELCFTGPGAGPDVTAVTVLDDVLDAATGRAESWASAATGSLAVPPNTTWFVRVTSAVPQPSSADIATLLAAHGVWTERSAGPDTRDGRPSLALLVRSCSRPRIERAASALAAATGSSVHAYRALEAGS